MLDINEIKAWLSQNRVCFVTNSICMPSSLYVASLKTYIEYIPIQNFWIINGIKDNEPFYGLSAFLEMLAYMFSYDRFDYVIYIDEDCFINDFPALINEFKLFKESNCCLGGPQDGGVFCHRTHSKYLINTFLSFWNIKLMKSKGLEYESFVSYLKERINEGEQTLFKSFYNKLKLNKKLYSIFEKASNFSINRSKKFRDTYITGVKEVPYCETVRNDPSNIIEQNRHPYTFEDDIVSANFEPYYIIEQSLILLTNTPIYYMFGTDLYKDEYIKNKEQFDCSGMTSAIWSTNLTDEKGDNKLIAVHTWFSRGYTKWPSTQLHLEQTKRINTIIKRFSKI